MPGALPPDEQARLRARAEARLTPEHLAEAVPASLSEAERLIRELRVHQLELEIQHEELDEARSTSERERLRYVELYDSAPTGYATLTDDGTITGANLACGRLLDRPRDGLPGTRLGVFVAVADRTVFTAFLDRLFAEHVPQECEVWLAGTDTALPRAMRMVGICGAGSSTCRVNLTEVTQRRRAEATLRLRDRAIQTISQGIVITDPHLPDHPIIHVNAGFEVMTGYAAAEVVGRNCRFLQGAGTDPETVQTLARAIERGQAVAVELLNYRKDGTPFWNALFITPVHDARGALEHFIGVQIDVTERRQLEQALHESQRLEAVGQLAGGIAHDFNNLLTIINGYCDVLEGDPATDESVRTVVREISAAGRRAAALTQQLLVFSRRQVMESQVEEVNDVILNLGGMLRRLLGENIVLRTDLSPMATRVRSNATQLEQVLINLAVNARDAMPRGGHLTIRTSIVDLHVAPTGPGAHLPPGRYLRLSVADDGTGMDAVTAGRVFEPFFTTKGLGKGTGLGLSMVHGIVTADGGHVGVASEPGHGTTFTIHLPVTAETPAPETGDGSPLPLVGGTETILVVEDERSLRALVRRILTVAGYTVLEAEDGQAALAQMAEHGAGIDLLVTDVVMPGMGGGELAERLAAGHPSLRVLYMSGYTDDEVLRHGIAHATAAFLQKPFTLEGLTAKVRQVLDQR